MKAVYVIKVIAACVYKVCCTPIVEKCCTQVVLNFFCLQQVTYSGDRTLDGFVKFLEDRLQATDEVMVIIYVDVS